MPSKLHHRRQALRQRILLCVFIALLVLGTPMLRNAGADLIGVGAPMTSPSSYIPVCGPNPALFPAGQEDEWDTMFRARVTRILASYEPKADCTGEGELEEDDEMTMLARALPMWGEDPVHDTDLAPLLLEYLDAYGCALRAQSDEIVNQVRAAMASASSVGAVSAYSDSSNIPNAWNTFVAEVQRRSDSRQAKLDATREVMKRVLMLIISMEKLRPLDETFVCLNRASKDLRNVLGLLADGSACVSVKTWDAKTPLRDLSTVPSP